MHKHLLLLMLQIKTSFKQLPKILLSLLVFSIIAGVIGFAGSSLIYDKDNATKASIKVAAVLPKDDALINMGFKTVINMESLASFCEFIMTDEDTAMDMMDNKEVFAVVIIPEHFIDDIQTAKNTPARVIISKNSGFETSLFRSVIDAGANSLSYVQSGIYATDDMLKITGYYDHKKEAEDSLNNTFIKYALNRSYFFDAQTVTVFGDMNSADFYICSGIVFMLLLSGISVSQRFRRLTGSQCIILAQKHISRAWYCFTVLFSTALIFIVLVVVTGVIGSFTSYADYIPVIDLSSIAGLLLLVLSIYSFIMFLFTVIKSNLGAMMALFISSLLMMYCSGSIIPKAYLALPIQRISSFMPTGYWVEMFKSIYSGVYNSGTILVNVIMMIVFFSAVVIADHVYSRD